MKGRMILITEPIYHFRWCVFYGGNLNDAIKRFCKYAKIAPWTMEYSTPTGHFGTREGNNTGFLYFRDVKPAAGTVAHEAVHAVTYLFKFIGMDHKEDSDEAYAYYVGFLVDRITKGK